MLAALNRWQILQDGQGITDEMRRQGPQYVSLWNAYLEEVEKYKRRFGVKNAYDSDQ